MNCQIVLLVLASVVVGTLANNPDYLRICPDMGVYNVPNPRSCNKYYLCFNGQVIKRNCAGGLNYDDESGLCKPAHQTTCKLEFCSKVSPIGVTMVADPDNCNKYYACSGGVSTPMSCPSGLMFNRAIGSCDFQDNVHCVIENENFEPTAPRVKCPARGISKLGNPDNCNQYSICVEGQRIDYFCAPDLRYDTRTGKCMEIDKARCAS